MSEGVVIALIGFVGAILGAAIAGFATVAAAGIKNGRSHSSISCGIIGLLASLGAALGLILGAYFGESLVRRTPPTNTITQLLPSTSVGVSPRMNCPVIVIEGRVGGLPIAQTKTWAELTAQWTTEEPQSAQLGETCSRDRDNEVQIWVGYWGSDPGYLDFRGTMAPDEAILLVRQNLNQPVIIVPWGE